ncbi:hypothetical protein F5Y14DRAFT_288293 [Nemania sp. NC0429]|nr:hypothetical protein F5Y14DRAFT_288293 [Nemania sp. NC0429]
MSPRRNKDIRGFFKPVGPSGSQTPNRPVSSPPPPPPSTSDLSSPLDLPSSPRTPSKPALRVFSRDDEIKGSDDEDDDEDSDDSLGSITNALGYRSGPAARRRDPNILSTPQAKRIASGIHRSPLTLQPKKHKFDLKALMSHSRENERTEKSIREADAQIAQAGRISDRSDESDAEMDPKRLEAATRHLFAGSDDEDGKGHKLRRAVKRSKDDETSSRKHCYFFSQQGEPHHAGGGRPRKNPFPRKKAVGRWKFLSQSDDARHRAFMMGMPHVLLARGEALPDEVFRWVLDEVCVEREAELRRQYINLAERCESQTSRLVNDMRLYALLEAVGGPRYVREHTKLESTAEVRHDYLERDWSALVAFLQLLSRIAPSLQPAAAISAVQLLLRMSMDPVVAAVVREHHTCAMAALVSRLAGSKSRWNIACEAICSYVYENIDDLELRATSLLSIPSSSPHLVDLRRRMAAESLFDEPGLGGRPIDARLSFARIRGRLDEDDFASSANKADFDPERLRVLTTLLDIVIDRADFMRPVAASTSTSTPAPARPSRNNTRSPEKSTTTTTAEKGESPDPDPAGDAAAAAAARRFDAEIDALAARINVIHDKIRDKASRKNVKLSLLGLEKRLRYAVRTRPPPKKDIFAQPQQHQADLDVPKQRDFMRQWAQKKKRKEAQAQAEAGRQDHREDGSMSGVAAATFPNGGPRRPRAALQVPA